MIFLESVYGSNSGDVYAGVSKKAYIIKIMASM